MEGASNRNRGVDHSDDRNDMANGYSEYMLATEHGSSSDEANENHSRYSRKEWSPDTPTTPNVLLSSLHSFCGRVVHDEVFQRIIVALIIMNSITMGLATFAFVRDNPTWATRFETLDRIFLWIFTIELSLQFMWNGFELFQDGWLTFDFLVIVSSWAFVQAQVIRAFRVIRALRVITRVKDLKDLVQALLSVIPRMAAIAGLLLLVFYIFGVMFTQLFHDLYRDGYTDLDYFSRLDITFFTLFQLLILDSWSDITRQCMHRYPWAWTIFITFTIISTFIVINLIIAVICNAVSVTPHETAEAHEKEKSQKAELEHQVATLQARVDEIYAILKQMQQKQAGD